MKTALVTGGAGFIGSHLCAALADMGMRVRALDNLSVTDKNIPFLEQHGVEFVRADITSYEEIEPWFSEVDVVFHLAAMNRAQRSIQHPVKAHHVNITGTLHVLEAMRKHNCKKIVFASSSSVYAARDAILEESAPQQPPHPYGVGKLAAEHYLRVYHELFDIAQVTLRFFSIYGPHQLGDIDGAAVISKFIHQARSKQPLTVYGDGLQQRNFTYVQDVVLCCIKAATSTRANGHIINVANSEEVSVLSLAKAVQKVTQTNVPISHLPALSGDPKRNPASTKKAQELLGYTPQTSLTEGIMKTVEWYDEQ